jgi:hypothetical protein
VPKVFVVNKASHDHTDAERFGEIEYLSEGSINRYSTNSMYREFYPKLIKSEPEDYILPTGLTIMSNIACGIFAMIHKRLNLLIYKASRTGGKGRYVERIMILDQKKGE